MGVFAYDFRSGDLYYNITSNSTAEVTYQELSSSDNYSSLTSAVIPESVTYKGKTYRITSIGDNAFSCSGLVSITIPNSVTSIGYQAFGGCSGLISVTIPNSVTSIGYGAFVGCSGLTSITIPNSVTSIESGAFSGCSGLTSITIPNGVTSIGDGAFSRCSGLTSITIPTGITSMGGSVFKGCSALTSVVWNAKNCSDFEYYNHTPFHRYLGTNSGDNFDLSSQITSFVFGDSVQHIPSYICLHMENLTSIAIPNSVTSIGKCAFSRCSGLISVAIPGSVKHIEPRVFEECNNLTIVTIHNGVKSTGDSTFYKCYSLTSITIPNSVTSIGYGAFSDCSGLASITIPNSVTSIGDYAFSDCSGLTSITIPNSVTHIKAGAFSGCSGLTSIAIPNSVTHIGGGAFSGCSGLTSIAIPNSVTSIGSSVFLGCSRLDSVIWNAKKCEGWNRYQDSPFYVEKGESNITSVIFGNGVESIPAYLCYGMDKLTSVIIPNSVTNIGSYAFQNCTYLEEVSLGTDIEEIGKGAFSGDGRIYSVTCYADVTPTIYESTFSGVSGNAELHVLANLVKKYKVSEYWNKFTIVPISVDNTTNGTLSVRPSDTDATFTWPADSNADSYTLTILKGDVVFCTLVFNGEGQLTSIAFAPARNGKKRIPNATLTTDGYKFTVIGLDGASYYTYQIVVKDLENHVLNTYQGGFRTKGDTSMAVENALTDGYNSEVQKIMRNGQVLILHNDKTYNAIGQEVE